MPDSRFFEQPILIFSTQDDRYMNNDFPLASQAEELLAARFARLSPATVRLASFRTTGGRHLGLARTRKEQIYIWVERFDQDIDGVEIRNQKRPGLPYGPDQVRSSAVNSLCANLAFGNRAYYLRCDSLGSLERFAQWYAGA